MPPSDIAMRTPGNLRKTGVHIRSFRARNEFIGVIEIITSAGASLGVIIIDDDDPMWRQTTVPVSSHPFQNGSQWSPWRLGWPSLSRVSANVTAWHPLAAV